MANIKGQMKRNRQNEKRRMQNNAFRSSLKSAIKSFESNIEEKNKEKAIESFNFVCKKLDKSLSKGLKHKNYVSKKKSSLAKLLNTL